MLVFWYYYASIFFFPNSSILNPIATYLDLIFPCFFVGNTALWYFTCIYCQKLVIHSNQITLPIWLLVYVTSFPVCRSPSAKFCVPALVHKMPETFIRNASLELISHHLPWTNSELNSTWLRRQNHTWTIRPL